MIDWNVSENWDDPDGMVEVTNVDMEQLCLDPIILNTMYITGKVTYNRFKDYCDILREF